MKLNQYGAISGTVLALILTIVILVASLVFSFWAFSGRQKYKNNADQLINTAVANAKQQQQTSDNAAFAIEAQKPLTQYVGPQAYGTISLYYPKNWSAYVNANGGSVPLDGYFYPSVLPSVDDNGNTNFALRMQVTGQSYTNSLQAFEAEQSANQATIKTYALPKLPNVVGVEVTGHLGNVGNNVTGTLILLPLRSGALAVWTEGTAYLSEFNNDILPNLSFSP